MRKLLIVLALPLLALGAWAWAGQAAADWAMNASIIEACSCPMFCQCYFNSQPSEHHGGHGGEGGHFCRFNDAFQVNRGHVGAIKLDGARFWVAGDLGAEFADGEMDWAALTFDPAVTPEQRAGIRTILGALYPVKWKSFTEAADAKMEWTQGADRSVARLGDGKIAEVVLLRPATANASGPVVIQNLKYWGAARNDGFVLMPNEVEAYRVGERAFEYKGTNGFMITVDLTSADVTAATAM